jgi:succinate dehydrogenase hydrophobic anchor subunit
MRNTRFMIVHMATGVLIAVLLSMHMVIMHLDYIPGLTGDGAADELAWESMIGRAQTGIWVAIYIALLAVTLYHALYGLRNIIVETTVSEKTMRTVTLALIVVGAVLFVLGTYVPVALLAGQVP